MRPLVLFTVLLTSLPAQSQSQPKTFVYVHVLEVDKRLGQDGSGLTSALCGDLMKDKRLEVVCETDMRQMMDFAALQALAGSSGNATDPVKRRMGQVQVLVKGTLKKGKYGLILDLGVFDRDPSFTGDQLHPTTERGSLRIKGIKGGLGGVARKLPSVAKRAAAMAVPGSAPPSAPPGRVN